MRILRGALLFLSSVAAAQGCADGLRTFATQSPFTASYFFGPAGTTVASVVQFFDVDVQRPLTVSAMRGTTYDQDPATSGVPNQVGATSTVRVWTIPGTSVGATGSTAGWTQIATGTITVTAWPAKSPIAFAAPFVLPAGSHGVAVELLPTTPGNSPNPGSLHVLGALPDPTPAAADQFLALHDERIQTIGWQGGVAPAGLNLEIDYTPDAAAARWSVLGTGCHDRPRGFYEVFDPSSPPDIAASAIAMQPLAGARHYAVAVGAAAYATPTGTRRNAVPPAVSWTTTWDDALDAPIQLPFVFDFPGGSTNVVTAGSNGVLYLASVHDPQAALFFAGDPAERAGGPPFLAPFHGDFDLEATPAPTGLYYETDQVTHARFTWHQVVQVGRVIPESVQITLWNDGRVDFVYGTVYTDGIAALVGFVEGQGSRMPSAPIDLSAAMPFVSGDGVFRPVLGLDALPMRGSTFVAATVDIMPGTSFALATTALAPLAAPLDLAAYGMPGCRLQADPAFVLGSALLGLAPGHRFEFAVTVPNSTLFDGLELVFQTAPLSPGWNAAGLLLSNGVCARIGW